MAEVGDLVRRVKSNNGWLAKIGTLARVVRMGNAGVYVVYEGCAGYDRQNINNGIIRGEPEFWGDGNYIKVV